MLGYWNAPFDLPDHTRAACRALLKIRAATTALNTATDDSGWRVRMGLESGESCTGVIGPAHQLRYVLFGEAITSAALFERQCETYGVDNVISDRALEAVRDFAWLELDMIKMKGDAAPLRLFTLLGDEQMAADPEYLALKADFDRMLTAYRRQGWFEAAKGIALCLPRARRFDLHALLDLYVRRIENLRRDPPSANWNGVHLPAMK